MKEFKIVLLFCCFVVVWFACSNQNNQQATKDSVNVKIASPFVDKKKNDRDSSLTFITEEYLKISNIYSGDVFEDDKTGNSLFFRVIEIPEEEHLLLYAEKISIGAEGGNFQLKNRYHINEKMLSLNDFSLYKIDSFTFLDSITISGYFNEKKMRFNLIEQKAK